MPLRSLGKRNGMLGGALECDSTLGEARTALAHLRFITHRDWGGAEAEFERALDLSPGYAVLHQWYGEFLRAQGPATPRWSAPR